MKTAGLLFVLFVFIFCLHGNAQINLNQGLVAYYPFNGNANDQSGNNNNGIVLNGAQLTSDRYGNINSAFSFDGIDDYIRIPNSNSLNPLNAISISLYFNPAQNGLQTILGKISYTQGNGTEYQLGMGYGAYPGVYFGLNPPSTGCSNLISQNNAYVNTGGSTPTLNQWHCLVATFENSTQKIYLDGVLIQTRSTGFSTLNQCSNSDIQIGSWWSGDVQRFKGKIDDVRIYNRALTPGEVGALCLNTVTVGFTAPDTVCVNAPLNLTNTSSGASSYYWTFCSPDLKAPPTGTNLGNPGNFLSAPVFVDLAQDNGNYYGFVVNHDPGGITRLDFGNSLLNTPVATYLGNISGAMNNRNGNEGIQIIRNNGNWYGLVVGGSPASQTTPRLVTIYFGPNLNNPNPTAVNWGNVGNMLEPIDLHVFQENGNWYGLTVNSENNTITRINFTSDLNNPPTGTNLGNIGSLNYPTGVFSINDNGNWRVFVANQANATITRLDFGNSLLNTPVGTNLGNPGNVLTGPRDITIIKYCGENIGFVTNAEGTVSRLNFSTLSSVPTATALGNLGNLNFPHSLSKLFRSGNDLYSLITNVRNNTITRLKFTGCSDASLASSNAANPGAVSYNKPGVYNINLTVDDGLATQDATCKQIVVVDLQHSPTRNFTICPGSNIRIGSSTQGSAYLWSTGSRSDSVTVQEGTYWVEVQKNGCSIRDSFIVASSSICDSIKLTGPDKVCSISDTIRYQIYKAPSCNQQFTYVVDNTFAQIISQDSVSLKLKFLKNGNTSIKVVYANNCKLVRDSINLMVKTSPKIIQLGPDLTRCSDTSFTLHAGPGFENYLWQNGTTDSTLLVSAGGLYTVQALNACGVQYADSFSYTKTAPVPFTYAPLSAVGCLGDSLQFTASGGTIYSWQPAGNFANPGANVTRGVLDQSSTYILYIQDALCKRDTLINIPVLASPTLKLTIAKTNDVSCTVDSAQLAVFGASTYNWSPNLYASDTTGNRITVHPPKTMTYYVKGRNALGCAGSDSVVIYYNNIGNQQMYMPTAFTPNGDGLNDVFRPKVQGNAGAYIFSVYDRWGELVFRSSKQNEGWNGKWRGKDAPGGVYVYVISAKGVCNGEFEQKGTFVLIR